MYPEQPKMVITQVINIPKGTRGRLHRALDEHRIHKWSRRKLQGEHDASITWIFHTPQTLITLTSANAHQSHLKVTSNAPQAHLKRTSNASQRRFDYLDFATLCPPKAEFFFFFLKIDCFSPCIKHSSHPIAHANLIFLKSIVPLIA